MSSQPVIWLVDDDPDVRAALSMMLRGAGFRIQAFADARALLDAVNPECRGCLIIDVRLGDINGLELQRILIERHIHMPRLFITGHGDIPLAVEAVTQGALDFLEKPLDDEGLIARVEQAIAADHEWASAHEEVTRTEMLVDRLTPRETEVMELMVEGLPSKRIATRLGAGVRTVEVHRARVLEKLEVANSAELIRRVIQIPRYNP